MAKPNSRSYLLLLLALWLLWLTNPTIQQVVSRSSVSQLPSLWSTDVLAMTAQQQNTSPLASPLLPSASKNRSQALQSPLDSPSQDATIAPASRQGNTSGSQAGNDTSPIETPTATLQAIATEIPVQPTATETPLPTQPVTATIQVTATELAPPTPLDLSTEVPAEELPDDSATPVTTPEEGYVPEEQKSSTASEQEVPTGPENSTNQQPVTDASTVQTIQLVADSDGAASRLFTMEAVLLSLLCLVLISINGLGATALIVTLLYIRSRRNRAYTNRLTKLPTYVPTMQVQPRTRFYD